MLTYHTNWTNRNIFQNTKKILKKMYLKMLSAKCPLLCPGLNKICSMYRADLLEYMCSSVWMTLSTHTSQWPHFIHDFTVINNQTGLLLYKEKYHPIKSKFCTSYNSRNARMCTKLWPDRMISSEVTMKCYWNIFGFWKLKMWVKWASVPICTGHKLMAKQYIYLAEVYGMPFLTVLCVELG